VQDITARKQDEAELAMHRQRLEELITKRTHELEHTHQRLRLSERMAALGTLSAGLGHDMGNLLLPLRLRLDSMEAKGVAPGLREDLDAVRKCTEYLQRLANGLRLFALDPDAREAASDGTDLNDWWADVYSFYKNALPRPVALEPRFAPDLPLVRMGRPNLTQAIFNLVQNAGEALRGREDGTVVVWAERGADEETIRLGVTDNGQGMSEEIRQRCLEPFFTTKTRGISTGLGLALVHGIVQKAGGTVHIETEQGRGTTFILTVPAARPRPATSVAGPAIVGRPRALVTIKDARMRAYVASVLHSLSFDVSWSDLPADEPAMLWLTDPNHHLAVHAREFLAADQDRRIIVLGKANSGLEKLSGLVHFSEPPKPAIIRQTLREVVGAFALMGLMESTLTADES
jgi:nitrogen-specific signal transduction histidine kinase